MITYWKSNAIKELSFFGQKLKNNPRLTNIELNQKIIEVLAKPNDLDKDNNSKYEDNSYSHAEKPL
jgi:hypothetical protein